MSLAHSTAAQHASSHRYPIHALPSEDAAPQADAARGVVGLDLVLRHAGPLHVQVRYELLGTTNAPVVLVAGGISADHHVAASEA